MKKTLLILIALFAFNSLAHEGHDSGGETNVRSSPDVTVDLPVVDAPFNFMHGGAYVAPSMRQSLAVSSAFYEVAHRGLMGPKEERKRWKIFLVAGLDILTIWTPPGAAWLHEEWHRATMTRRGIGSYNDVNNFPIGSSLIAVSHVQDDDLVRFKRDHPAEHVRMSAAGMESQVAQNLYIEKHQFFYGARAENRFLFWLNNFNVYGYLTTCGSSDADSKTDSQNREDGTNISKRDFTGLDCTAWAYDLFRPDEPYTNRGVHPSGVGIDRYIRWSDLSDQEKDFLKRQSSLALFNFVDPFLIGFNEFEANVFGHEIKWNAKTTHFLTSFGYTVDAHLLVKTGVQKYHLQLHNGFNDRRYFPGFSFSWIDYPIADKVFLTSDFTLWAQPKAQRYNATENNWMVAGGLEVGYQWKPQTRIFVGLDAKTPGWMAGQVFIDRAVTGWSGVKIGVF